MRCGFCGLSDTLIETITINDFGSTVADPVATFFKNYIWRTKKCESCKTTFDTVEVPIELIRPMVAPLLAGAIDLKIEVPKIKPDYVIETVAEFFEVRERSILGPNRARQYSTPRAWAMFLARQQGWSYPTLGRAFKRDHSTVRAACDKIESAIAESPAARHTFDRLRRRLEIDHARP